MNCDSSYDICKALDQVDPTAGQKTLASNVSANHGYATFAHYYVADTMKLYLKV